MGGGCCGSLLEECGEGVVGGGFYGEECCGRRM